MAKPEPGTLLSDIDGIPVAVVAPADDQSLRDAVEAALGDDHPHADHAAVAAAMPTTAATWRLVGPTDRQALADDAQPGWLAPTGTGPACDVVEIDVDTIRRLAADPDLQTAGGGGHRRG